MMCVLPKPKGKILLWLIPALLVSLFLSFYGYKKYLAAKRTALVERLEAAGATVHYTYFGVSSMPAFLRPYFPALLLPVKPRVFKIDASKTRVTDATLRDLELLPYLSIVHLENCSVSDVTLERLRHRHALQVLKLTGTQMTDQGLQYLEQKQQLVWLELEQTAVTPEALNRLRLKINQYKVSQAVDPQCVKQLIVPESGRQSLLEWGRQVPTESE